MKTGTETGEQYSKHETWFCGRVAVLQSLVLPDSGPTVHGGRAQLGKTDPAAWQRGKESKQDTEIFGGMES